MAEPTSASGEVDIVEFLSAQHGQIKDLMGLVRSSTGDAREQWFYDLRLLLALHEAAEERVVHPQVRRDLPQDDHQLVEERLIEELKIKDAVLILEGPGHALGSVRVCVRRIPGEGLGAPNERRE